MGCCDKTDSGLSGFRGVHFGGESFGIETMAGFGSAQTWTPDVGIL